MNYWDECIRSAFEDAGIVATEDQIKSVVETVQGGHENYSMYTGQDQIEPPVIQEFKKLKIKLEKEKAKRICEMCGGRGSIHESFGSIGRSSISRCISCNGEGKK